MWGHIYTYIFIYTYIHGHCDYWTESAQWADSVKISKPIAKTLSQMTAQVILITRQTLFFCTYTSWGKICVCEVSGFSNARESNIGQALKSFLLVHWGYGHYHETQKQMIFLNNFFVNYNLQ